MTDHLFTEEIRELLRQLSHQGESREIEEWQTLTPMELGVLSWHLGNFYCLSWW